MRDPGRRLTPDQLNGGRIADLDGADWDLIRPYLEENERLFGIQVTSLLRWEGMAIEPGAAYVKVVPTKLQALSVAHD